MSSEEPMDGRVQRSIDRRALIRRAVAAGTVAWTAPVLIESLASPAAAATLNGCFRAQFNRSGTSFVQVAPDNGAGCVPSTCWNGRTAFTGGVSVSGSDATSWTFSVASGCVFLNDSAARKDNGNVCVCATGGAGTTTIVFPGSTPANEPFDRFKLIISCSGASCDPCDGQCIPS
jgi:hypothetical protein